MSAKSLLCLAFLFSTVLVVQAFYGPSSDVEKLTSENFKEKVLDSADVWLVEFFAPWCGHCKVFAPEFLKAATTLKGVIRFGAVNAEVQKALADKYEIKGYPTVKYFSHELQRTTDDPNAIMKHTEDFSGSRTAKSVAEYALSKLPSKYAVTSESLHRFLALNPKVSKVILCFNSSSQLPVFEPIEAQFRHRLIFGILNATDKALTHKYHLVHFPSLVVIRHLDNSAHVYENDLSSASAGKFLNVFAARKSVVEAVQQGLAKYSLSAEPSRRPDNEQSPRRDTNTRSGTVEGKHLPSETALPLSETVSVDAQPESVEDRGEDVVAPEAVPARDLPDGPIAAVDEKDEL
mmetsp:Transcript_25686/g.44233  ORF Transcript_25686/g.44233 Transcript_25686/m.44233 type:complete len:348 (-) Transcript_25686:148-1191(-)|eukprot:CAMPEP_0196655050 /NCGR_PEP_ID=MMETSP1086-20130531/4803_1 /TAXON_ID=77921 /ORGANISM="Cyanoptyche  gloeocystis , Strain SAG4.97" /LENGTH=347 /DNA_ID=CAMNT_0041987151 /DNA_START=86 /DNA_END=1129 /DNA_ORIENTATION=-